MALLMYKNEYIEITRDSGLFYVKSLSRGFSFDSFNEILNKSFPNVKITSFLAIKNVLLNAPSGPVPFGEERERVSISVSSDALKAYMTLYVSEEDLSTGKRLDLIQEIFDALNNEGIVYGINTDVLAGQLKSGVEYLIAEGTPAVNGEDSKIKLYKISTPKPQVIDSGKVNHYELNLINQVKEGDWLGERIDATPGTPGKNVKGKIIPAIPGRTFPLLYDRISVREVYRDGVTTLLSKKNGAVYYKGDTIGVYDFLEIKGNIDFSTGNIDFDGFLSVKGTVEDNFAVSADKDIEILGEYGVGAAENIISRDGNIYIKGGIAGKGKAVVKCKKNLYVKFLSDITVECEGSVYVGFYCLNANIRAKQVIVESPRGRIIGGQIDADICVSAAEIGNRSETRTLIKMRGFNRNALKADLDSIVKQLNDQRQLLSKVKHHVHVYSCSSQLTDEQHDAFEDYKKQYANIRDKIKELEYTHRNINTFLKTPGECAVIAHKRIYPRVRIEIMGHAEEVSKSQPMITYYFRDNSIKSM
ncbi:MAG: DUF342 domain-containing protein [Clostridiaceae bacterium]|nr:DUF342 domain-containing protein [Clostridiaceae bacterium]